HRTWTRATCPLSLPDALPISGPRRVALLGRPNVGKSSLLNKAAGEERVVVNEMAGTTRDPVDEQVEIAGRVWTFVDTAGIRRRVDRKSTRLNSSHVKISYAVF